jgi:YidC/Oxa1 family membrane protein insertase
MLQHHFVTAWVPAARQAAAADQRRPHAAQPLYQVRSVATPLRSRRRTRRARRSLWVGRSCRRRCRSWRPTLTLGVDYGCSAFISQPLFWLLSQLHKLLGNWGWSIIAIVLILKALLYWPSKKQYQSMAKMRAVKPRIEALKERYGDDKQALNVAMFELYKKEKVNPAAGCWPILIQMPIFLGLYWVLVETVELRHAPWIGWIQNLTAPDPVLRAAGAQPGDHVPDAAADADAGHGPDAEEDDADDAAGVRLMMAFFPAAWCCTGWTNGALGLLQPVVHAAALRAQARHRDGRAVSAAGR